MCGEVSWNFHVRIIGEGYTGESITCERLIAHFVKGGSGWCLINAARQVETSGKCNRRNIRLISGTRRCIQHRHAPDQINLGVGQADMASENVPVFPSASQLLRSDRRWP